MSKWIIGCVSIVVVLAVIGTSGASPSRQVWIPSTDVQTWMSARLDIENYFRSSAERKITEGSGVSQGKRDPGVIVLGATVGALPFEKVRGEVGIDYTASGTDAAESSPVSFHAKVAIPELAFGSWSPAFAAGVYNYGLSAGRTNQNITYGLASYTVPLIGRLSAGGYHAGETATGPGGVNYGILASWDRLLLEFSDRFWVGVDYMGGKNVNSSVNFGVSWAFYKNAALLVGYNLHTERSFAGTDTITTRVSFLVW